MYSQCPSCKARFRVTAATLRAAHGRARCGRCGHEFDVLDRLSDEPPGSRAPPVDGPKGGAAPLTLTGAVHKELSADPAADDASDLALEDYHFSAEDIEKVFIDARDWQKQYGSGTRTSTQPEPEPPPGEPSEVEVEEPESVEDITLEGLKADIASETGESLHLEAEFDYLDDEPEYLGEAADDSDEESDDSKGEPEELDDDEQEDLDSTSRLRTLEDVPESAYPDDEGASTPDRDDDETAFYRALIEGRELPAPAPDIAAAAEGPGASTGSLRPAAASAVSAAGAGSAAASRPSTLSSPAKLTPIRAEIRPTPAERWSEVRRSRSVDDEDDLADLDLTRSALPSRRGQRWLAIGSVLLALTLAAQVIHHYRQAIVRHPQAGETLRRVYAALGQPLSPNWDLDAFEVRQWGPTVDVAPGEPLTVRASVTNRAAHAQPYPLLRLEFEDRFGTAVAQRDFLPSEYLKSAPQAARLIAAGETTEAELSVVAPDGDAVGYTLDICLRQEASRIRCAHGDG